MKLQIKFYLPITITVSCLKHSYQLNARELLMTPHRFLNVGICLTRNYWMTIIFLHKHVYMKFKGEKHYATTPNFKGIKCKFSVC